MYKILKIAKKDDFLKENEYIFKKYKLIKRISEGTFGNIYSVIRLEDKKVFAMKTEKINSKEQMLESEAYYLYILQGYGIPKLISFGQKNNYNILIETLLDKSLHYIYIRKKTHCNINDLCLIAIQLIDRLEWIHSKDIVYGDAKPENFLFGIDDPNVIYIVDFGLCKKYRSSKTGKHILPKMRGKFSGTLSYASVNVLRGKVLSRRDDLISLGYVLIKLIKKSLPWMSNFNSLNKRKYIQLVDLKQKDGCGKLFESIPGELVDFVKYSKSLKFEQDPDYSYLRSLFIKILAKKGLDYKVLSFTFVNQNQKKYKNLTRNNSTRKTSPYYRILKKFQEEGNKKDKSEFKSSRNLNINQNFNNISISINHNIQILANTNKKIINNYIDKNYAKHEICSEELKSKFNNKGKINSKEIIKFYSEKKSNEKNNFKIKVNERNNNKIFSPTNSINKKYINNKISKNEMFENRIRAINKKNKVDTSLNKKLKNSKSYYNINKNECLKGKHKKIISGRNEEQLSFKRISEKLNLSNHIHHQSQLFKNKNFCNQNYNSIISIKVTEQNY